MKTRVLFLLLGAGLVTAGCQSSPTTAAKPAGPEEGPEVRVDPRVIDEGEVDLGAKYVNVFPVKNTGDKPLVLTLVKKSCSCGDIEVPSEPIAPGAAANVTFRWSPLPGQIGPKVLSADFETNDARKDYRTLRLEVKFVTNPRIRLEPAVTYLDFGSIKPRDRDTAELVLKVFSTKLDKFTLDASTGTPGLAVAAEPLAAGEVVGDRTAKCGYRLTVKTTDRMPLGYFRDDLLLKVKVAGEEPQTFTLPVYAVVDNGAFAVTPSEVEFTKPKVTDEDSKRVQVRFLVPSDKDSVEVLSVEPKFLTTTKAVKVGKGVWEFTVKLPKNSEAAKYQAEGFFEGQVLLKTSASDQPIPVRVKWVAPEKPELPQK
jgi:hypothetical protein